MAKLTSRLTIVPIRVSNGRAGGGGARASTFGGGAAGRATTGGRREAENSGRSRVAVSAASGTAHNGLPLRDVALGPDLRLADEGAAFATRFPSALRELASTRGLNSARSPIGSAADRAVSAQPITTMAASRRINLLAAIAQRPRQSFACARPRVRQKTRETGSRACPRTSMA